MNDIGDSFDIEVDMLREVAQGIEPRRVEAPQFADHHLRSSRSRLSLPCGGVQSLPFLGVGKVVKAGAEREMGGIHAQLHVATMHDVKTVGSGHSTRQHVRHTVRAFEDEFPSGVLHAGIEGPVPILRHVPHPEPAAVDGFSNVPVKAFLRRHRCQCALDTQRPQRDCSRQGRM